MNFTIDRLLEEAKLTAVQEMFEPELYKFAELIIQECCVTADANVDDSKYPSYHIRRKFGVEW